jgi:hypothetical protein
MNPVDHAAELLHGFPPTDACACRVRMGGGHSKNAVKMAI